MLKFNLIPLVVIYINYLATISILKQILLNIININKLNLRLIRVSQYLFLFNLELRYKTSKFNTISNVLFRLL